MRNQLDSSIIELSKELASVLIHHKLRCSVAESCTGGSLGAAMTELSGSSVWFERGFITYSNQAKEEMLGVHSKTLAAYGAVSEETARAMAHGAMMHSDAHLSAAITGIAGPDGGSEEKPVGLVWIAWAGGRLATKAQCFIFKGDRQEVRKQAVQQALTGLIKRANAVEKMIEEDTYFFALHPTKETAQDLHNQALQLISPDCVPTAVEKLHITLLYLGKTSPAFLKEVIDEVSKLQFKSFALLIDTVHYWAHHKISWLGMNKIPPALLHLVEALQKKLIPLGFKPERRHYTPHITIARNCDRGKFSPIDPILWEVGGFSLLKSTQGRYEIVKQW